MIAQMAAGIQPRMVTWRMRAKSAWNARAGALGVRLLAGVEAVRELIEVAVQYLVYQAHGCTAVLAPRLWRLGNNLRQRG